MIIVGAGLSGIGGACQLKLNRPRKSFVILEGRHTMGGTWDLFRYPGVRSDSDMYTLGYRFRPWREAKAMAAGPAILSYIRDTAAEYRVDETIRYNHRVRRASWSSDDARWIVEAETGPDKTVVQFTCNGYSVCTPRVNDPDAGEQPVIDFNSGYVLPALHTLPRQGTKMPWRLYQNYVKDLSMMRYGGVDDGTMEFKRVERRAEAGTPRDAVASK